jgi:quercetin dioxygenase-like cupin family protein
MSKGDITTGPDGTEILLGDVGTNIVLENDHVRIWEVALDPGQSQPWHLHEHPYVIVAVEPGSNRMDFLDGGEPREMEETPGRVVYRDPGRVHMLTNRGQTRYVNRLIELKDLGDASVEPPAR